MQMNVYSLRKLFSALPTDREEGGSINDPSASEDGEHGSGNGLNADSDSASSQDDTEGGGGVRNGLAEETAIANTLDLSEDALSQAGEGSVQDDQALSSGPGGDRSHG